MHPNYILSSPHPLPFTPFKPQPPFLHLTPLHASNNSSNTDGNTDGTANTDTPRPQINTLNIRYRARSKRQAKQQQQQQQQRIEPMPPPPKKEWESMTLAERAIELYVGEKGLLFWLNKFAYASIFIIIGGWILFRFVGPSIGLYQLDAPPLSPTNILKGSS